MVNPNKIKKLLAFAIVLAVSALTTAVVYRLHGSKGPDAALQGVAANVAAGLDKMHFAEIKNGVKQWDLVADKVVYDKNIDVTHLTTVKMIFPSTSSSGNVVVTSKKADYYNKSRDVHMVGDVMAKSGSGVTFTTGHAEYLAARGLLVTDDHVRYTEGGMTVEGVGMEFLPAAKTTRVMSRVTARINPSPKN